MSRPFFISLGLVLLALGLSWAQEAPFVITSDPLTARPEQGEALFEGNVMAQRADTTLRAQRMLVRYSPSGGVSYILAEGRVRLVRGALVVVAGRAEFFAEEEKVVFTQEPRATEADTVITGSEIIYLLREGRTLVKDSKVFIKGGGGEAAYP